MSKFEEIIRQIYGTSSDPLPDYTDFGLQCMDRLYDMVMEIVEKEFAYLVDAEQITQYPDYTDDLIRASAAVGALDLAKMRIKAKLEALKGER